MATTALPAMLPAISVQYVCQYRADMSGNVAAGAFYYTFRHGSLHDSDANDIIYDAEARVHMTANMGANEGQYGFI